MGHSIDLSQLKSGFSSVNEDKPKNPNDTASKNIDGLKARDFGNGLKEFDPTANGFEPVKIERKPNDKDRALQAFDEQMKQRREEVEKYNELLDQYGGQITEEELRSELGQDHITQTLHDGVGGEFEDNPGKNIDASSIIQDNEKENNSYEEDTISPELDNLERELEMEDNFMDNQYQAQSEQFVDPNLAKLKAKQETEASIEEEIVRENKTTIIPDNSKITTVSSGGTDPINIAEQAKEVNAKTSNASGVKPIDVVDAPKQTDLSEEDKDLKALEDDNEAPVDDFDEKLKEELAKKMRPVSKKFDLSHAVVASSPITVTNALSDVVPLDRKIFTWGLYRSKRSVSVKAFTATELNNLSGIMDDAPRSRDVFKAVWDHIVRGKGNSFDAWLKSTSYYDVNHLWFAVYGACFSDTNYLPYTCSNCNNITVSNDIPLETMCKFKSDEVKAEFNNILKMPSDAMEKSIFAEYRVQVSDSIVMGLREPSIYDAVIATNLFDAEFSNKYRDIIGLNAYIANIYKIGVVNGQVTLYPISVKQFIGNETKTLKARIIQYAKIIRSLTSDQYNIIMGHINALNDPDAIYYRLPAVTCDHCKKEIPEEREAAADLVFMRHRLAILGV